MYDVMTADYSDETDCVPQDEPNKTYQSEGFRRIKHTLSSIRNSLQKYWLKLNSLSQRFLCCIILSKLFISKAMIVPSKLAFGISKKHLEMWVCSNEQIKQEKAIKFCEPIAFGFKWPCSNLSWVLQTH